MRKLFLILVILTSTILSLSLSSISSETQNNGAASTSNLNPSSAIVVESDTEKMLLKQEVELLKNYNQQLLNTIYWSIGAVFTLALFVVGAGWYVNFRLYEKDKNEIQRSLNESLGRRFAQETEALKEQFQQEASSIKDIAKKTGEKTASVLQKQFSNMQQEMLHMQYKMLEQEAKSWRDKKVFSNEFYTYSQMLAIAKQLYQPGWEWLLSATIEGMQKSLKSGAEPDVEEVRKTTKVMDSLDKSYLIEVSKLKELLAAFK